MVSTFVFPNRVLFGLNALEELPGQLRKAGAQNPLLVTDAGLVECGLAERVLLVLTKAGLKGVTFSEVDPNPTEKNVLAGLEQYRAENCDAVLGLGGGSALDAAKGIRLKTVHDLPLGEYAIGRGGWDKITHPMPPMGAVPTTAGTGSEVGRGAVLIVPPAGEKIAVVGEEMFPTFSICDPELTRSLPPLLTAGTGMDALTHCVEEYISTRFNPLVDGLTLEGIRLVAGNLVRAFEDGNDMEARGNMMIAAMIGGIGFMKGLGVVHSLAHPIGGVIGCHHGTSNAILLPGALEFNFNHCLGRFRPMATATGIDTSKMNDEECGHAFIGYVRSLNDKLGIPGDLSALGARREQIEEMIPMCMADHCHATNPRPCTAEDFRSLLNAHIP